MNLIQLDAVGLDTCVYLWSASADFGAKLCDMGSGKRITSLAWTKDVHLDPVYLIYSPGIELGHWRANWRRARMGREHMCGGGICSLVQRGTDGAGRSRRSSDIRAAPLHLHGIIAICSHREAGR